MQNVQYNRVGLATGGVTPALENTIGPLQKLAFAVMSVYLFIILSRMFDVAFSRLRIPLLFFCLTILFTLIAGNLGQVMRSRTTRVLAVMLAWIGITSIFSSWRSASFMVFTDCTTSFVFALAILALSATPTQSLRLMRIIGYSILAAALLSSVFGKMAEGRLTLYQGSYGDPNNYAMCLLLGLPYWLMMAKQTKSVIKKILCWGCMLVIFTAFIRTGSRGGAIAFGVMMLVFFLQATALQRLLIVVGGILAIAGAAMFLPDYLQTRYLTLFNADQAKLEQLDDKTRTMLGGDIGSSSGRLELLIDSLSMTARHPLFGVGPGQFANVRWEEKRIHSIINPGAIVTHNAYTQMSSENGVPGLIILTIILVGCYKAVGRVLRLRKSEEYRIPEAVIQAGVYHRLSLTSLVVGAFFLSVAYIQLFWIMSALSAAYYHAVENSLPEWKLSEEELAKLAAARKPPPTLMLPALNHVRQPKPVPGARWNSAL